MTLIWNLVAFVIVGFLVWSVYYYWSAQPADKSQAQRALGAIWAGLAALAAWVGSLFVTPPL